ncbi:EI24 domain-containing protein [Marinimicrococcus flavescens]|uniref:EI24 domain-containing protein n=1 Tax=Marinimicrococcus flavescens TaxID=3031815 RepID=A0AAP3UZJ9_9PROT|nr:EI24 domain-containing protein [Marinimicrococcus flavescens]
MLTDIARSFGALGDRRVRGVLWRGITLALATLIALGFGVEASVDLLGTTGYSWIDRGIDVLGVLGTAVVAWLLFPSIVVALSSFFLERVVDVTEARFYPGLPPARLVPLAEQAWAALRLLGLSLLLNLAALPLYLVPVLNLPIWLLINGWLVGREYVELVALRRMRPAAVAELRRERRIRLWAAGALVAFLLTVPLLNLAAPVLGAAFMTHRLHRLGVARPESRAA